MALCVFSFGSWRPSQESEQTKSWYLMLNLTYMYVQSFRSINTSGHKICHANIAHRPFIWSVKAINISDMATHLGHLVGMRAHMSTIDNAINDLYANTNVLTALFGHCNSEVKYKLFKSFAMPLYCSSQWDYSARSLDKFSVAWRR
jgi:hypothetical protein